MSDAFEVISAIIERMKADETLAVACRDRELSHEFRTALTNIRPRLRESDVLMQLDYRKGVRLSLVEVDGSYRFNHAVPEWYESQHDRTLIWLDDLVAIKQDFLETPPPDLSLLLGGAL